MYTIPLSIIKHKNSCWNTFVWNELVPSSFLHSKKNLPKMFELSLDSILQMKLCIHSMWLAPFKPKFLEMPCKVVCLLSRFWSKRANRVGCIREKSNKTAPSLFDSEHFANLLSVIICRLQTADSLTGGCVRPCYLHWKHTHTCTVLITGSLWIDCDRVM